MYRGIVLVILIAQLNVVLHVLEFKLSEIEKSWLKHTRNSVIDMFKPWVL